MLVLHTLPGLVPVLMYCGTTEAVPGKPGKLFSVLRDQPDKMRRTLREITTSRLLHSPAPFFLVAGPCALESLDATMRTAESLREMSERLRLPVIFKASFDHVF